MPLLPPRIQSGQNFKSSVLKTINQIIQYLNTQRIVGNSKDVIVQQFNNGIGISIKPQITALPPASNSEESFPFRMYFGDDGNDNQVLHIQAGWLHVNGDDENRIGIGYQGEQTYSPYVPLPDEEGEYIVALLLWFDPDSNDSQLGWVTRIVYFKDLNVKDVVDTCGYFYIMLGKISATSNNNELSYQITKQWVKSDFAFYDGNIKYPFKAYLGMQTYPNDGAVIDQPLYPYWIKINPGKVYLNGKSISVNYSWFQLGANPVARYYIFKINTVASTVNIGTVSVNEYVFTEDNIIYNVPICRTILGSSCLISVIQSIDGNFCFAMDDKKVCLNEDDEIAGYLEDKYQIPIQNYYELQEDQKLFYDNLDSNSHLKAIRFSSSSTFSLSSMSSSSVPYYEDKIFWDYKGINGFNGGSTSSSSSSDSTVQILTHVDSIPAWNGFNNLFQFSNGLTVDGNTTNKLIVWGHTVKSGYNITVNEENVGTSTQSYKISGWKTIVHGGNGIDVTSTTNYTNYTTTYTISLSSSSSSSGTFNSITSQDGSIIVNDDGAGNYDLSNAGQVKCNANDTLGYLDTKITVSNNLSSFITLNTGGSSVELDSAIQGTGVLVVQNGQISVLQPSGNAVLGSSGGNLTWIPYAECELACDSSSSSGSSESSSSLAGE